MNYKASMKCTGLKGLGRKGCSNQADKKCCVIHRNGTRKATQIYYCKSCYSKLKKP